MRHLETFVRRSVFQLQKMAPVFAPYAIVLCVALVTCSLVAQEPPMPMEGEMVPPPEMGKAKKLPAEDKANPFAAEEEEKPVEADKPEVAPSESPFARVSCGEHTILNDTPPKAAQRKENRPDDLWFYYMHGVTDACATPVSWKKMLGGSGAVEWLDNEATLVTPIKRCDMPAIRIPAGKTLYFRKPILSGTSQLIGKTVRVFVWMKGAGTGKGGEAWMSAPGFDLVQNSVDGQRVNERKGTMKTRGTFPWHCYYEDIFVGESTTKSTEDGGTAEPEKAAAGTLTGDQAEGLGEYRGQGVYLKLYNPTSGDAWFSTVSWEVVTDENTYAPDERQDPNTGSMAANPRYDEFSFHLCRGMGRIYPWTFLKGKAGGALNVPDMTRKASVDAYVKHCSQVSAIEFMQSASLLASWYHQGAMFQLLPELEPGWLGALRGAVCAAQDEKTGLWTHSNRAPSIALTSVILDRFFSGARVSRKDRVPRKTPWFSTGDDKVPHAEAIAKTILSQQREKTNGKRTLVGGWPKLAYNSIPSDLTGIDPTLSLAATSSAVSVLRRIRGQVGRSTQVQIDRALRQAYGFIMAELVTPEGLWVQNSMDSSPTSPAFIAEFLETMPILEHRVVFNLKSPHVSVEPVRKGRFTFSVDTTTSACVSVRIYAVGTDLAMQDITHGHLVGIVQKGGESVQSMDPFLAVASMRAAGRRKWGSVFEGRCEYTNSKLVLSRVGVSLPVTRAGQPLSVYIPKSGKIRVFAAAVNSFGEESRLVQVLYKVAEPDLADAEKKDETTEKPEKQEEANAEEDAFPM